MEALLYDGWIPLKLAAAYENVSPHTMRTRAAKAAFPVQKAKGKHNGRPTREIPVAAMSLGAQERYLRDMGEALAAKRAELQGARGEAEAPESEEQAPAGLQCLQGTAKTQAKSQRNLAMARDAEAARANTTDTRPVTQRLAEVAERHGVSVRTLRRIEALYQDAGDALAGADAVVPGHHKRGRKGRLDGEEQAFLRVAYLDETRPSQVEVYEWYANVFSRRRELPIAELASERTVARFVGGIGDSEKSFYRWGPGHWLAHHCPRMVRDHTRYFPNGWWTGDHREFDLFVLDEFGVPRRPWLTAWIDLRTRELVGYCVSFQPNQDTIAKALQMGIRPYGLPEHALTDRGRDYKSHHFSGGSEREAKHKCQNLTESFTGALDVLGVAWSPIENAGKSAPDQATSMLDDAGIERHLARPRSPWSKPIEPWFNYFVKRLESKCTHSQVR